MNYNILFTFNDTQPAFRAYVYDFYSKISHSVITLKFRFVPCKRIELLLNTIQGKRMLPTSMKVFNYVPRKHPVMFPLFDLYCRPKERHNIIAILSLSA